jgi:hypothetical protein
MTISLSQTCLPVCTAMLGHLSHLLDKARTDAQARSFDANVHITERFAPDMLPFKNQIFIACDVVKNGVARVAGMDAPKFDDSESTIEELQARIHKTLAWLATVPASAIDGREEQSFTFPVGKTGSHTMRGQDYVTMWILPNMYFHITTAYNLLRSSGVPVGKRDYLMGANQP